MTISRLYETICQRRDHASPNESYTARLITEGEDKIVKKIGEEAVEVILAAKSQGDQRLIEEVADLTYHVLRFDLDAASVREARLVMKLAGKASKDGSLPPVDLDVRVNGPLESLLNFGLQMNSGSP